MTQLEIVTAPPENSSHKFIDLEEEENLIPKDKPNEHHNPRQQKSNTKKPLEGTGEGNAKKSKTFHLPQEEPSISGIDINLTTPVVQGKGSA